MQRKLLETITAQRRISHLQVDAELRVSNDAGNVVLIPEIDVEKWPVHRLLAGVADARGGSDRKDEGDNRESQQDQENQAEVMLERFLDPRNHGMKPPRLDSQPDVSTVGYSPESAAP